MPAIHVLDPHVSELIAAGEVVERPGSVVKELLENAVDAGASAVTVELQAGGLTYLRVTDNGCGIAPEDVLSAFLRHATSKLRTSEDLAAIGTLGFRGEALAAIAAVSKIDLLTRQQGADTGCFLSLEGGVPGEVTPAGCPEGTTIIVRDLFYNTPARMKFMKRDSAEAANITGIVSRIALSRPDISFRLIRDGKPVLRTPGDGQLRSAAYGVLGRDIAFGLVPVRGTVAPISVEGLISRPVNCRGSRNGQFFFVNGRTVQSRLLTAALEEAYRNRRMVGKFPACVLHVTLPLNEVDVNVHPAKTEVKFLRERNVFDAVYHTVKQVLDQENAVPAADTAKPAAPAPRDDFFRQMTAEELRQSALTGGKTPAAKTGGACPAYPTAARPAVGDTLVLRDSGAADPNLISSGTGLPPHHRPPTLPNVEPRAPIKPLMSEPSAPAEPAPPEKEPAEEAPVSDLPWRVAGEVLRTYVIVEQGDEILLIDKHAAHERINFDRLRARDYTPMAQTLLTPLVLTLSSEAGDALLGQEELLDRFGFTVEPFGGNSLLVRQVPDDLDPSQAEAALLEIGEALSSGRRADPAAARDAVLKTIACKAAIKAGQHNGPAELEAVARAVMEQGVRYCPHGRPVSIRMTRSQLEKQFGRT